MRHIRIIVTVLASCLALTTPIVDAGTPAYDIVDLGVIDAGDSGVQGLGVSDAGVAVGRTLGVSNQGFVWTETGGLVPLRNLPGKPFGGANASNDVGQQVGTAADTFFGSGAVPIIWNNGVVAALPFIQGENVGRANDINDDGLAVGSNGGGIAEVGVYYENGTATAITTTTTGGSTMTTAFGVNNSGLIVGNGIDPLNPARNVGLVYDLDRDTMIEVGALPGDNGALAFGVSNAGHVCGSSSFNQSSGMPYVWTEADGMTAIPLPVGATSGSARDVNVDGLVVGNAGGTFAVPWVYDGAQTHRIQDLIDPASAWDLSMNTSSSAVGISDSGIIVGTGVLNGEVRAYALLPAGVPCPADCAPDNGDGTFGNGVVNIDDVLGVINAFGTNDSPCDNAPDNGDGTFGSGAVNIDDVLGVINAFGPCL